MKIVVLHNEPGEDAAVDPADVLVQRDAVSAALDDWGHEVSCLSCSLDLATVHRRLLQSRPDAVFNLVESLGGTDRLMTLASMLLDSLQLPYTGAPTEAVLATSNKVAAKESLLAAGLPTPTWFSADGAVACRKIDLAGNMRGSDLGDSRQPSGLCSEVAGRWILKPVWEHASFAMDDDAVIENPRDAMALEALCGDRQRQWGRPFFVERFVDGREFNLSLLAGEVLPAAEIDFATFPADKPRIVGQRAKWVQDSVEYQQTPRRFDFPPGDVGLLEQLAQLARQCWQRFGLRGYARVDFRVDDQGQPWILEINANPCLSPDAGYAAALARAGILFPDAIQRIVDQAFV